MLQNAFEKKHGSYLIAVDYELTIIYSDQVLYFIKKGQYLQLASLVKLHGVQRTSEPAQDVVVWIHAQG